MTHLYCRTRFSLNLVHSSRFWTGWTSRDQKCKFPKFTVVDGRHFENRYIAISQWKIIGFSWNFVYSSRFWTGWPSRDQKWNSCIGQSSTERISCSPIKLFNKNIFEEYMAIFYINFNPKWSERKKINLSPTVLWLIASNRNILIVSAVTDAPRLMRTRCYGSLVSLTTDVVQQNVADTGLEQTSNKCAACSPVTDVSMLI